MDCRLALINSGSSFQEMIRCNFLCHQSQSVEVAVNNCVSPGASGEQRDYTIDLLSTNV